MILFTKFKFPFILAVICLTSITGNQLQLYLNEVRSLSELPLNKLIEIKSNLEDDVQWQDFEVPGMEGRTALALPLKRFDNKSMRRGGHGWDEKGKGDSKISKIFQFAITALSFLAFGGYLLALVILAIKKNAAAASQGNVIVFSNLQRPTKYKRPKRSMVMMDPSWNDYSTEKYYRGMIMLSEGYVSYSGLK